MYTAIFLPILVSAVGFFLLIKLRAFVFFHPIRCIKRIAHRIKSKKARRALLLAMAGTLGVGNIFGVSAGIIIGGAGSVFWLIFSSAFSIIIKYSEALMSTSLSGREAGGMHVVLKRLFPRAGTCLGGVYAVLCVFLSLFMGSAIQSSAVINCAAVSVGVPIPVSIATLLALVAASCFGGVGKIEKITEKIIPLTTIIYIIMSFAVLTANFSELPTAISKIFESAFSPMALGGGALAILSSKALTEGFARGILSNEAGSGTSSLAHTRVCDGEAADAGLMGACEVFFDTDILCLLTGLAILVSVENPESFSSPMKLVESAYFSVLGELGSALLLLCIFFFAYSTIICWYYYGSSCFLYFFDERHRLFFLLIFLTFIPVGGVVNEVSLLPLTDTVIFFMSILTLVSLIRYSESIRLETERAGLISAD